MNVTKKKGAVLVKALGKPKAMKKRLGLKAVLKNNWQLYLLVLPAVIYFVVFNYLPLYGIQIAFKDYKAVDGIAGILRIFLTPTILRDCCPIPCC